MHTRTNASAVVPPEVEMGRRKRQTHLTFEPVVASRGTDGGSDGEDKHAPPSPKRVFAPANVRYSQHAVRVRSMPRFLVKDGGEGGKAKKAERRLGMLFFAFYAS